MSKFRERSTGDIKTETQIRAEKPNTSFPKPMTAAHFDALGYDPILPGNKPTPTDTQIVVKNGVEQDGNGNWVEAWTVADKPLEQIKTELTAKINGKRDEIFYSSIPYGEHSIEFRDDADYVRLNGLLTAIDSFGATEINVIVESNDVVTIPAATYKQVMAGALARNSQASINARNLKNAVESAETIQDLPDIETGWPS